MIKLISRVRFQKKYLAFFSIVPLLIVTTLVEVDCPVCEGDGHMTSNPGMENVRIVEVESEEVATMYHACGMFLFYNYDVKITLENSGDEPAIGWLKMVLIDFVEGKPMDTQYKVIEVPEQTNAIVEYSVWFVSNHDEKKVTEVATTTLTGDIPDETCNGTGKIPINTYPLISSLKDKFQETVQTHVPWVPPDVWFDDEENY
jgi:hypothetical protein